MNWPADHPLCGLLYDQDDLARRGTERALDWDELAHMNEFHGNAAMLKEAVGWPLAEPLPITLEHAIPYDLAEPYQYDLNSGLPGFLAVNEHTAALYREGGRFTRVEPIGHIYLYAAEVFNRRHPGLPEPQRRGTLVFPDKSTLLMDTDFDRAAFAARLTALPAEYQPVVVCAYWRDIARGTHRPFVDAGLPVVSCGHLRDHDFMFRLHDLCRRFRYACANDLAGSFTLSILSGCHFFYLPGGPLTWKKHGQTHTAEADPTLAGPDKAACMAAAPFPPQSPDAQRLLAARLAGVSHQKQTRELHAWLREAREALLCRQQPMYLRVHEQTELSPWLSLLPQGIDRDGWLRAEAQLTFSAHPDIAAVQLTLDMPGALHQQSRPWELQITVGDTSHTVRPEGGHSIILQLPCPQPAREWHLRLHSSACQPLLGEPRVRSARLAHLRLLSSAEMPPTLTRATSLLWKTSPCDGKARVHEGPWKLLCSASKNPRKHRLHNLLTDPAESTDLGARHPDIVQKLAATAEAWLATQPGVHT
jgi:hypothetical protein